MSSFLILLGTAAVVIVVLVTMYNGLIGARNRVKNAWSQIDVQLKRRHDLIPNLVETVKGYVKHERETLEAVTKARQQAIDLSNASVAERAKIENFLTQTLKSLFAVSEAYPDLKANENFLSLQEEITTTENRVSFSRQAYNDEVLHLNNKVEMFPTNIIAGMFNFTQADFFEIEDLAEKEVPKVQF
ncbi:MAG: LemA family protein [Candidatus Dadabacteria bacterium]|nr:LemA family protein [Candidatus Dadabacteria bacterium]NIS08549.1 LemA family protein [Candidatus Dadabacteria bacterium]NIV41377.1 LemA family protein [Candidatus Dadabacteria bacterium]NIX14584.1 LemA family protein [Candidatus Dadabacteria bacterium]NIY21039.1 LemA family protein [Candidatus Dadabacteria bacterium]